MVKLILTVPERLLIPLMLPKSSGMIGMELKRSVVNKIRFSPEEISEYELKDTDNGMIVWNKLKAKDREFRFEDSEVNFMKKAVEALDKAEQITDDNYDLAKKLMAIKTKKE